MLTKQKKQKTIKEVAIHAEDTGSAAVQIAILSKRIEELAKHLKTHAKDNSSRRGLLQLVADRQKHMKYLAKKDPTSYTKVLKTLELKKKSA